MSISNIVDYINKTPGNTNPSVVKSMVEGEMNSTLKEANAYTDSQRLGYSELTTIKVPLVEDKHSNFLILNGLNWYHLNFTASEGLEEDGTYIFKLNEEEFVCKCKKEGDILYLGNGAYGTYGPTKKPINGPDTEEEFCLSCKIDTKKIYICLKNQGEFVYSLYAERLGEKVHKIEPKYIPVTTFYTKDYDYVLGNFIWNNVMSRYQEGFPSTWGEISGNLSKLCDDLALAFSTNTSVRLGINDGAGRYTIVELMPMIDYYGNISACFGTTILGSSPGEPMCKATIGFSFETKQNFLNVEPVTTVAEDE